MTRLLSVVAIAVLAAASAPVPSAAQIEPRTCGVLDGPGCNPGQCSVLDGPGCQAQAQVGVGQGMLLTLGTRAAPDARRPGGQVDTIRDLFALLRACWSPPAAESAQHGIQMSMRFSLNRAGMLIGEPRVTYATPEVSQQTRDIYRDAMARSLRDCTPLPFTAGFAGAIAGRPIVIRIIDDRADTGPARRPI